MSFHHYRQKAKRGQLTPSPASPKGHRHKINTPRGHIDNVVDAGLKGAAIQDRFPTIKELNPGRK